MADDRKPSFGIANLSGLLAGLWVILAWLNPEVTYHLAPPLVAASFPVGHRLRVRRRLSGVQAFATFVGAVFNLGVAIAILTVGDKLRGPSLLPTGGAVMESVLFGVGGAVIAAIAVALPLRSPGDQP